MKRIITLALLGITLTTGAAMADRDRGYRNDDRRHDRVQHRDRHHREYRDRRVYRNNRVWRGDNRRWDRRVYVNRTRPAYRNNTFYFEGGVTRVYRAPQIRYSYRNYSRRPQILIENYDPMPGYIWVAGQWSWTGYEWTWTPGYYDVDVNYGVNDNYNYNGSNYNDSNYYEPTYDSTNYYRGY